jgi:hypothetical protein
MSDFVETLPEGQVERELARALQLKRPFRRFKDVLLNYPEVQEDWFRFHEQGFIKIIQEWLEDRGVEVKIVPFHAQAYHPDVGCRRINPSAISQDQFL